MPLNEEGKQLEVARLHGAVTRSDAWPPHLSNMPEVEYFATPSLDALEAWRVFSLSYNCEAVTFVDECDGVYACALKVDEFRQLITELQWILNQIETGKAPPPRKPPVKLTSEDFPQVAQWVQEFFDSRKEEFVERARKARARMPFSEISITHGDLVVRHNFDKETWQIQVSCLHKERGAVKVWFPVK